MRRSHLAADLCIVSDTTLDARFARSPSVVGEPFVRFYAGIAFLSNKGQPLGTLCVMDKVPRKLNEVQQQTLRTLAKSVEILLGQHHEIQRRFASHFFELKNVAVRPHARDGTLTDVNPAGLRQLDAENLSQVRGCSLLTFVAKKNRAAMAALHEKILRGQSDSIEYESLGLRGRSLRVQTVGSPIRNTSNQIVAILYIMRDITETGKLEQQLLHSQRMENVEMLAAGIAHDLNNILTPMMMLSPLLAERLTAPGDQRLLTALDHNARRGAVLIKQILAFAQGANSGCGAVDLKHVVLDLCTMIEETFPHNISLTTDLGDDLIPVSTDCSQVHQILLNLCINARDAMPEGGELHLQMANSTLDLAEAAKIPDGRPGEFVLLEVSDTGSGIPPELHEKIWDPFFTTKPAGKGTGLGLSTVHKIVQMHGGFGTLDSAVGAGTRFRFYLPVARQAESGPAAPSETTRPAQGKGQTILIVDDEPYVRDFLGTLLGQAGYRTLVACSGREALQIFAARKDGISLVITENDLPVVDGTRFAAALRNLEPAIGILFCTSENANVARVLATEEILGKPFDASDLFTAVQNLLVNPRETVAVAEAQERSAK